MAANGYLPAAALVTAQTGIRLSAPTSIAWEQLRTAARTSLKRNIRIATPAGGYRSFAVQRTMQQVSKNGTFAEKRFWGLSTSSTASLAAPGNSDHGLGICVDIVGTVIDTAFVTLARRFGFTRPLPGDPNHFQHDGRTAIHIPNAVDVRKMAAWLNREHLGKHTGAEDDGVRGPVYYWLLQTALHKRGRYPVPPYRIDGVPGSKTNSGELWLWEKIR